MKKYLLGILTAAVMITAPFVQAFAAGTVSISGDKDTAVVGDQYTVSVTIEGADGDAVAPDVSVNYDVNRLEFVSCSGEYGGGGGYITLSSSSADVTFNILSGGQADVDVTAIFDGDGTTAQVLTASVMVEGEDTAAVNDMARDDAGTGVEPGSVATSDGRVVSAVFADEFMPVGFYKTTVTYEEQMVEAAQFDMGGIVLLYVTDADGNNGNFAIYDQATGQLSDFLQITGIENRFIIALKAGEEVEVPENFTKATLQWNAQTLEAYAYTGTEQPAGVNTGDFFLIYAISSEGNQGFYMYDQSEGTYQRYVPALHGSAGSSNEGLLSQITSGGSDSSDEGGVNVMLIILIALAVLLVALVVTVIIMAVKLHEFNSYDYIDEDEEDEDEEESYLERLAKSGAEPRAEKTAQREQPEEPVRREAPEDSARREISEEPVRREAPEDSARRETAEEPSRREVSKKADVETWREERIEDDTEKPVKSTNIYEQYRKEDELRNANSVENTDGDEEPLAANVEEEKATDKANETDIPEGFVVRNKKGRINRDELIDQEEYERDGGMDDDDYDDEEDFFSPRERRRDSGKLSRAEKKALKQEEKARKKAEKRMKKEYGEYGPVDWDSWQSGIEGGERTAAAHMNRSAGVDEGAVRRAPEQPARRAPREEMPEQPVRRAPREEMPEQQPVRRAPRGEMPEQPAKDNPMDMMRGIPANDNKAPVQAKPVQQFDFDDDFEFEFLDLDDED